MKPEQAVENPNVRAFLRAIRLGEGTADADGYRRIVGGELFSDFRDHPRKRVWIERYRVWSTAAGAYQIIAPTWDEMRTRYRLPDFSPRSQDLAGAGLLIRRGALDDIIAGRIEDAAHRCRLEWASLPSSPYGQRTETMARVLAEYAKHGGRLVPAAEPLQVAAAAIPELLTPRNQELENQEKPENRDAPVEESRPVWDREGGWSRRA